LYAAAAAVDMCLFVLPGWVVHSHSKEEGGWMRQIGAKGLRIVSEMPIFALRLKRVREKETTHHTPI
jgi:hypothetical protein